MYVYVLVSPLGGPHSIRGVGAQVASGALNYVAKCTYVVIAQRHYRGTGIVAERAKCRQRAGR